MGESAWQRASKDTRHAILDTVWYQVAGLITAAVGGLIVAFTIPNMATSQQQGIWGVVGAFGTALALMLATFLWNWHRAPVRQRNEARQRVRDIEAGPKAALSIDPMRTQWVIQAPYRTLWRIAYTTITNNTPTPASLKYVIPSVEGERTPLERIIVGERDALEEALYGRMPIPPAPLFERNQVFGPGESRAGTFVFIDWAGILAGNTAFTPTPNLRVTLVENNGYVHEPVPPPASDKAGSPPPTAL